MPFYADSCHFTLIHAIFAIRLCSFTFLVFASTDEWLWFVWFLVFFFCTSIAINGCRDTYMLLLTQLETYAQTDQEDDEGAIAVGDKIRFFKHLITIVLGYTVFDVVGHILANTTFKNAMWIGVCIQEVVQLGLAVSLAILLRPMGDGDPNPLFVATQGARRRNPNQVRRNVLRQARERALAQRAFEAGLQGDRAAAAVVRAFGERRAVGRALEENNELDVGSNRVMYVAVLGAVIPAGPGIGDGASLFLVRNPGGRVEASCLAVGEQAGLRDKHNSSTVFHSTEERRPGDVGNEDAGDAAIATAAEADEEEPEQGFMAYFLGGNARYGSYEPTPGVEEEEEAIELVDLRVVGDVGPESESEGAPLVAAAAPRGDGAS